MHHFCKILKIVYPSNPTVAIPDAKALQLIFPSPSFVSSLTFSSSFFFLEGLYLLKILAENDLALLFDSRAHSLYFSRII